MAQKLKRPRWHWLLLAGALAAAGCNDVDDENAATFDKLVGDWGDEGSSSPIYTFYSTRVVEHHRQQEMFKIYDGNRIISPTFFTEAHGQFWSIEFDGNDTMYLYYGDEEEERIPENGSRYVRIK